MQVGTTTGPVTARRNELVGLEKDVDRITERTNKTTKMSVKAEDMQCLLLISTIITMLRLGEVSMDRESIKAKIEAAQRKLDNET
jgi:hypothetical protein